MVVTALPVSKPGASAGFRRLPCGGDTTSRKIIRNPAQPGR